MTDKKLTAADVFAQGSIVPVLIIKEREHALPIARALIEGGINVLEVTLRTDCALDVISDIAREIPEAMVGAGTVANKADLDKVREAGAKFAISPGSTRELLEAGNTSDIPLIPGISSTSELMKGLEYGYRQFKFFPAEASGGVPVLKSISGPFPDVVFCPTGGINLGNVENYLKLPNVACCGGSWLVPDDAVAAKDWGRITELARQAVAIQMQQAS